MKPVVVHLITPYLFHTGSWIYSQLTGIKSFRNVVYTQKKENLDLFPFEDLYSAEDFNFLKKNINRIYKRFSGNFGLFFTEKSAELKPRFFHAHMGYEAVRWLSFVKKKRLPLLTTFYGLDVSKLGRIPKWRKQYCRLFDYGTIFLAEGSYLKKQLVELGCPAEKVKIQHLGVPANITAKNYRMGSGSPKIVILQVSTFREKKGIEYSLKAISKVVSEYQDIEFRLIGSGDTPDADRAIVSIIDSLGIKGCVTLLGIKSHSETIEEMLNADVFLHPSVTASDGDNEGGAPVSVIEASAVGLPVVSTFHADIPEVVLNNKTGYLVGERDSDELARKLLALIKSPADRVALGTEGRKHILSEYNLAAQIEKLEETYRHLMNE